MEKRFNINEVSDKLVAKVMQKRLANARRHAYLAKNPELVPEPFRAELGKRAEEADRKYGRFCRLAANREVRKQNKIVDSIKDQVADYAAKDWGKQSFADNSGSPAERLEKIYKNVKGTNQAGMNQAKAQKTQGARQKLEKIYNLNNSLSSACWNEILDLTEQYINEVHLADAINQMTYRAGQKILKGVAGGAKNAAVSTGNGIKAAGNEIADWATDKLEKSKSPLAAKIRKWGPIKNRALKQNRDNYRDTLKSIENNFNNKLSQIRKDYSKRRFFNGLNPDTEQRKQYLNQLRSNSYQQTYQAAVGRNQARQKARQNAEARKSLYECYEFLIDEIENMILNYRLEN